MVNEPATQMAGEQAGLYIHIPFCSAICPYCDFAVQRSDPASHQQFIESFRAEVERWRDWTIPFDTIYLGGGTPSALRPVELAAMLECVRRQLPVAAGARLHLEVNPEDVTPVTVRDWKALGVHMLSMGVQSFDDAELRTLGRRHTGAQARAAVERCIEADFHTLSVDLIFGLPEQTAQSLQGSLDVIRDLTPSHVSCYQLTVHEGTTFGRWRDQGRLQEMPEDDQAARFWQLQSSLASAGLHAYEVSNYARGDLHRSAHNQKYWQHQPYLGLGPSAHSFDGQCRWWNTRALRDYVSQLNIGASPIADTETLSTEDLALEMVMLGIRTVDGINLTRFHERFGYRLESVNSELLSALVRDGYLLPDPYWIRPTAAGLAVADGLAAEFQLRSDGD